MAEALRNENFSWDKDALWSDIEEALPEKERNNNRPFGWLFFVAGIALLIGISAFFVLSQKEKAVVVLEGQTLADEVLNEDSQAGAHESTASILPKKLKQKIDLTTSITDSKQLKNTTQKSTIKNTAHVVDVEDVSGIELISSNVEKNDYSRTLHEEINETKSIIIATNQSEETNSNVVLENSFSSNKENKDPIVQEESSLSINKERTFFSMINVLPQRSFKTLKESEFAFNKVTPMKTKKDRFAVALNSGVYKIERYFSGDDAFDFLAEKEQLETPLYATKTGLDLSYKINKNIFVSSGIDYLQINEKLEWAKEVGREESIIVSDSAAYYTVGTERTYVEGDLNQTEIQTRNVTNYNSIRQINIPIRLAFKSYFNKLEFTIYGGLNLNLSNKLEGRFINDASGDFTEVSLSDNKDYKSGGVNSYSLGLSANHPISKSLSLGIGFEYDQFLKSINKSTNLPDQKYNLLGLKMGLNYSF